MIHNDVETAKGLLEEVRNKEATNAQRLGN